MRRVVGFCFLSLNLIVEVAYDAQRDEKEQHETKMREVKKVEELRKEKEAESNGIQIEFRVNRFVCRKCSRK